VVGALFTSITNAVEDHDANHTLSGETFERWQERVRLPLRTPGRIHTSHFPLAGEQSPLTTNGSTREPSTPDVDLNFEMEEEEEEDWRAQETPDSMITDLRKLCLGLENVSNATSMMHRDFVGVTSLHSGDLRTLDCRVQALNGTVGVPCHVPGIEAQTLWNDVSELGSMANMNEGNPSSLVAQAVDLQQRVGSLQDDLTSAREQVMTDRTRTDDRLATLEGSLEATLTLVLDLQEKNRELSDQLAVAGTIGRTSADAPIVVADTVSTIEFNLQITALKSEMSLMKQSSNTKKGLIKSFSDILPGVNTFEDVVSWVVANFGNADGGDGDGDPDSTFLREFMGGGPPEATYTGFCDIYSLLAVFEDLDSISNKGETLRAFDMIKKSGVKHPAKATVIYSLKKIVPGIFGKGLQLRAGPCTYRPCPQPSSGIQTSQQTLT
jgi:hypothetical protein